jgi:c-di-GMP-binding flagellar brake protein YcgR
MEQKRVYFRVADYLDCEYKYNDGHKAITRPGKIMDISGGGMMILDTKSIAEQTKIFIDVAAPLNLIGLPAKVVKLREDLFIDDNQQKKCFTIHAQFDGITIEERKQVIAYVYKWHAQRRQAILKRLEL